MFKNILFILLTGFVVMGTANLRAQQKDKLFMPGELQKAYQQGTRSFSGQPGSRYFQNKSDYTIKARFNPETGVLDGHETIVYHNNSPDSLQRIVMRVYMNIFQKGVARDFGLGPQDLHGGVEISNLTINGHKVGDSGNPRLMRDYGTIYVVALQQGIHPGDSARIALDWKVQLPQHVAIRMGQYGKGHNWFVAYWYPQISVYDDVYGWDTHPFTGSAEFYNDFNDYDVSLTLPGDYMVWATGRLQNPQKHYQSPILSRIEEARQSDQVVPVVKPADLRKDRVLKDRPQHTWHFEASDVPDFAFATSKNYIWDATSVEVDHQTGRRTFMSAVYDTLSDDFDRVAEIGRKTIRMLSDDIMGVPFAYPKLTAFNGSGGMEFPMMINDGDVPDFQGTVHLTAHEIGHNYFPFYVMTNESYYAFMDEGLVSFLPRMVEKQMIKDFNPFEDLIRGYASNAGTGKEVPLMVKSYMISDYEAYRLHAYQRPATAFYLLRDLVGPDHFHKALKAYIQRWARKHPTPYDFFYTFEDVLDRDLSWFWEPWFFDFGYPDLAVKGIENGAEGQVLTIKKKGNLPVPLYLKITFQDGTTRVVERSAEIWKDKQEHAVQLSGQKKVEKIELGRPTIPDAYPENNQLDL